MASSFTVLEHCSCGASIRVESTSGLSGPTAAVESWRSSHRHIEPVVLERLADGTGLTLGQGIVDERIARFKAKMPTRADALLVPAGPGGTIIPCWKVDDVERAMAELYR